MLSPLVASTLSTTLNQGNAQDNALLSLSIEKSHARSKDDLLFFPYFSIRIQEVQLNLEHRLIGHLASFFSTVTATFSVAPSKKHLGGLGKRFGPGRGGRQHGHGQSYGDGGTHGHGHVGSRFAEAKGDLDEKDNRELERERSQSRGQQSRGGQPRASYGRRPVAASQSARKLILYIQEFVVHPV